MNKGSEMVKTSSGKLLIFLILTGLFIIGGCGKGKKSVEKSSDEQILHIGNGAEPQDLDPHIITGVPESNIVSTLFEGLVIEEPENLTPLPGAAMHWEVSEDGKVYTFYLRKNGKWSNGEPITAHDFVFSFKRILSPALGSEYAYMLYVMKNAERYHKGEIKDFSLVGAHAIDDYTLKIILENPTPYFLSLLTHTSWFPVHRQTIEDHGAIDDRGTGWTKPESLVGNGAFALKQWDINTVIIVEKNENYWDSERVRLKEIHFHPIENTQTEERTFRSGQLHLTYTVPHNKILWYKEHNPEVIKISPYLGTYYYILSVNKPPLDDPRVRKALSLTIDRKSIVRHVLKGGQMPAFYFTPPRTAGYTCEHHIAYDIELAKELLDQAGYPEGHNFPPLELLYNTSEMHHTVAQAVQQMWKKNLNITITLTNQEWKVYLASTKSNDYDIARAGWIGDYLDPNTFLDLWITRGGNNRTGWSNDDYDRLIKKASEAENTQERFSLFNKAEDILLNEMPVIPLFFYTKLTLIDPCVRGWYPNILDHHPYKFVYLECPRVTLK
jgi:oligopeptide transport system substrate-binding protein